jgi:uncharacterized SAM-binding protein YcdF (DUF218 family)
VGDRIQVGVRSRIRRVSGGAGGTRPRRRGLRRVIVVFLVIFLAFAAATARLIVWPAQGMPARADAVIMLAGPGDRLPVALRLAAEHKAPVLVVSRGNLGYGGPCPAASAAPGVKIICFEPVPADTRGETEFVARLAERNGWRSVVLVTTTEQDTRARVMMRRCYPGSIYVVTASQTWTQWPYQVAYGWGALFKALFLQRAC